MSKKVKHFKSEHRMSRADATAFLHQLADKVQVGEVSLKQGPQEHMVNLPHHLFLKIKVKDKSKKDGQLQHSLEIELKWFDDIV